MLYPTELGAEAGRMHGDELRREDSGSRSRRADRTWRRGLREQLEALRRRLALGRRRRSPLSQIQMARYTGARV